MSIQLKPYSDFEIVSQGETYRIKTGGSLTTVSGPKGNKGDLGGSFAYEFDGGSQTMADPGPGLFRLNNATPASATAIALAADLVDASDVSDLIVARLQSTSTVKARLVITTGANRLEFNVTAVTDNTAWLQLTIAGGSIVGSVADEGACELVFEETGDKGDQGLNISEQFAVALFDDTAINVGGYYVTRKAVADATIDKVYAEIIGGTALSEADVYLEINGLPVYGPFTVTQGSVTDVSGLSISVSQDDPVNWVVTSLPEGTVTELYVSATGGYV